MSEAVKILKYAIGSWPAIQISNQLVALSVVPSLGGRVMELHLGGTNVFYGNPRHLGKQPPLNSGGAGIGLWRNYGGSKVWPGPQGWSSDAEWPGPPDPVLDSGPYDCETSQNQDKIAVNLKSQHDEYSGVTLEREIGISPGTSVVRLHHRMRNTSKRTVRWSIWQVTQVDATKGLDIFVPAAGFHQTLGDKPYPSVAFDEAGKRLHLRYHNQVAKLAVEANQGWFASLDQERGVVLVETFPVTPGAPYPDGAPAAFWVSGAGTFTIHGDCVDMTGGINGCDPHVEAEVMGPITRLEPGESSELRTSWRIAAISAEEIVSANDCGAVGRKLAIENGRVTGSFGVFSASGLELIAYDRASQVVETFALGKVTPLRAVVLDEKISLPSHVVRCSLMLFDEDKHRLGILDHVQIR